VIFVVENALGNCESGQIRRIHMTAEEIAKNRDRTSENDKYSTNIP